MDWIDELLCFVLGISDLESLKDTIKKRRINMTVEFDRFIICSSFI